MAQLVLERFGIRVKWHIKLQAFMINLVDDYQKVRRGPVERGAFWICVPGCDFPEHRIVFRT